MAGGQNDTLANSNSKPINGCVLGFCVGLEFNSPVMLRRSVYTFPGLA